MNYSNLSVYLNDHLAGAAGALDLFERLTGLLEDRDFAVELRAVQAEIENDRKALEALIKRLGVGESTVRKASGWIAEKAAILKLLADDPGGGPLRIFESLEALSLGIEGKRSLWMALGSIAENIPAIDRRECEDIVRRSEDQRQAGGSSADSYGK